MKEHYKFHIHACIELKRWEIYCNTILFAAGAVSNSIAKVGIGKTQAQPIIICYSTEYKINILK